MKEDRQKEISITEWNHKVCKMMDYNSVDLETAILYLERNSWDLSKASDEYKNDLRDCGK